MLETFEPFWAVLGRIAADHRDDALALLDRKQAGRAGTLLVVERPIEPALLLAAGDLRSAHSFSQPQQRDGALRDTNLLDATSENLLQRRLIFLGNLHAQGRARHASSMP